MNRKKALIAGASGLIGSHCLNILLEDEYFEEVEALVRKPLGVSHPKLKERVLNFTDLSELPQINAGNVFCCLGTTIRKAKSQEAFRMVDYTYVVEIAKLAERSGSAKFMVVSSIGANKNAGSFYLKVKGEMEETVKKLSIPSIYIFRPSILLGRRKEFRIGEIISKFLMKIFDFLFIGKFRKYKGIEASAVASAMVRAARNGDKGIFVVESDKIDNSCH